MKLIKSTQKNSLILDMHQVLNDSPYCQLIFDIPAVCLFKTNYVYAEKIVNISINQLKKSLKHI